MADKNDLGYNDSIHYTFVSEVLAQHISLLLRQNLYYNLTCHARVLCERRWFTRYKNISVTEIVLLLNSSMAM